MDNDWTTPQELSPDIKVWPGDGDYLVFRAPDHPLATKKGTVSYHRHMMSVYLGRWITLDELIHFKDGNPQNCSQENMELVDRFDLGRMYSRKPSKVICTCDTCGEEFSESPSHVHRRSYCSPECAGQGRRKFDPSPDELREMLDKHPTTWVAEYYEVSDKAVAKRAKKYGIEPKGRGYWNKIYAGQRDPSLDDGVKTDGMLLKSLDNDRYKLISSLWIVVENNSDGFIARAPDLEVVGEGETKARAVAALQVAIVDLYEELIAMPADEMGELPKALLKKLRQIIAGNYHDRLE